MTNKKASALVMVLIIVVVCSILGAAIMMMSLNENNISQRQKMIALAFNIAEAGLEQGIYDLRAEYILDQDWSGGVINSITLSGPDADGFYTMDYPSTAISGGSYEVKIKTVSSTAVWLKSQGTYGDVSQILQVYGVMSRSTIWDNAIFAGQGAAGTTINGCVDVRGSVHILGTGLDPTEYVVDLGGTAELIGNNYSGLDPTLEAKVPALPTVLFNGEVISTINAELRVKRGMVGLSGAATAGQPDIFGNGIKETIDGSFVTDGFGGTAGSDNVHSDNGWSNAYDLGDTVVFPSLSDPYPGYATYQDYLRANALVISDPGELAQLANIDVTSNFNYTNANGTISMDGSGNMVIDGIVYIEGDFVMDDKNNTILYTNSGGAGGTILSEGNIQIDTNLLTPGNNSYPTNILGIMTPNDMTLGSQAQLDIMGLFYAENKIIMAKQTNIMGTIISNFFDLGGQVPKIYQVPQTVSNLPPGMIGDDPIWRMSIISWQRL